MNHYIVRVWYQGQDQSQEFAVKANTTQQAEEQVWAQVNEDLVVMFDTSRLETAE